MRGKQWGRGGRISDFRCGDFQCDNCQCGDVPIANVTMSWFADVGVFMDVKLGVLDLMVGNVELTGLMEYRAKYKPSC